VTAYPAHEQAADLYRLASGERLRRRRRKMRLSVRALGELVGLGRSILTRYEAGMEPSPERKVLLADALGVSPDDIWHFREDEER
jgi:transcriptional regulator with XRE-family HTH domain